MIAGTILIGAALSHSVPYTHHRIADALNMAQHWLNAYHVGPVEIDSNTSKPVTISIPHESIDDSVAPKELIVKNEK